MDRSELPIGIPFKATIDRSVALVRPVGRALRIFNHRGVGRFSPHFSSPRRKGRPVVKNLSVCNGLTDFGVSGAGGGRGFRVPRSGGLLRADLDYAMSVSSGCCAGKVGVCEPELVGIGAA